MRFRRGKKNNRNKDLPKISDIEWEKINKLIVMFEPLYSASQSLQMRTTTITSVIPFYLWLKKKFSTVDCDFDVSIARVAMSQRLDQLMQGWSTNKFRLIFFLILIFLFLENW